MLIGACNPVYNSRFFFQAVGRAPVQGHLLRYNDFDMILVRFPRPFHDCYHRAVPWHLLRCSKFCADRCTSPSRSPLWPHPLVRLPHPVDPPLPSPLPLRLFLAPTPVLCRQAFVSRSISNSALCKLSVIVYFRWWCAVCGGVSKMGLQATAMSTVVRAGPRLWCCSV